MSELKHARALLDLAEKDLKALQGMGDANTFADEVFGFHAQQAVEKTLKAWLAVLGLGQEYPLTHNLARLLALLEDRAPGLISSGISPNTPFMRWSIAMESWR